MSDPKDQEEEYIDLVDPVNEYVSTDIVSDIKSGIFALFNNLYSALSVQKGPVIGLLDSIEYLQSIIDHFQEALEEANKDNI